MTQLSRGHYFSDNHTNWLFLTRGTRLDTDATGNPTVGYGHLCANSRCTDISYSILLSLENGKKLLATDMIVSQTTDEMANMSARAQR